MFIIIYKLVILFKGYNMRGSALKIINLLFFNKLSFLDFLFLNNILYNIMSDHDKLRNTICRQRLCYKQRQLLHV